MMSVFDMMAQVQASVKLLEENKHHFEKFPDYLQSWNKMFAESHAAIMETLRIVRESEEHLLAIRMSLNPGELELRKMDPAIIANAVNDPRNAPYKFIFGAPVEPTTTIVQNQTIFNREDGTRDGI